MTQMMSCFTVTSTALERTGKAPLVAVARYAGDGRLVDASVLDPEVPAIPLDDLLKQVGAQVGDR